ncbi:MAG: hypothetical protein ABEJ87_03195 [Candidatus Nanohalobium sp.]
MADVKQYAVLVVGLLMAGGFAFGGIASYAGLVNTGGGGNKKKLTAELPTQTFKEGPYNLTARQRMYLSLKDDAVIVSAVYNSSEGKEKLMPLKNLTDKFTGRAFISVVNASDSKIAQQYRITQYPKVLVFGFKTSRKQVPATVDKDLTPKNVGNVICSVMKSWGNAAPYCTRN